MYTLYLPLIGWHINGACRADVLDEAESVEDGGGVSDGRDSHMHATPRHCGYVVGKGDVHSWIDL